MAYMSKDRKAKLAPNVKAVLKKYGLKGSLRVDNGLSLCLWIKSGKIDFIGNALKRIKAESWKNPYWEDNYNYIEKKRNISVNHHHIENHYEGIERDCLVELRDVMNEGNHDRSDLMTDYHDVGWYIDIEIGRWNRPYELIA